MLKIAAVKSWRKVAGFSLVATLLVTSSAGVPALAADKKSEAKTKQTQIGNQISQLRDQADEVSEQEADLLGRLDAINNRKADIEARTKALQAQIDQVQRELDEAEATLAELARKEADARSLLIAAQAALEASSKKMREQAVDAYVGGQQTQNLADFVLRAEDMRQVAAASEYLNQVVQDRRSVVEQHRELQGQAEDLTKQIAESRAQAQATRDTVAAHQQELAGQKAELDSLKAQAAAEQEAEKALLAEIDAKKAEINAQIASLQQESDKIAAMLRGLNAGGAVVAPSKGILAIPVPGARLTSVFGMRVNPVTGVYTLHAGQDFGVSSGTPIHAAADGTVVSAGWVSGYGNYTCINHGGGLATCYAHQSQFLVSAGQRVSRNQVIGLSGNTGNSTGPHLHFEVRVNGTPTNPMGYL